MIYLVRNTPVPVEGQRCDPGVNHSPSLPFSPVELQFYVHRINLCGNLKTTTALQFSVGKWPPLSNPKYLMRIYFITCTMFIISHLKILFRMAGQGGGCSISRVLVKQTWGTEITHMKPPTLKTLSLDMRWSVTPALLLETVAPDSERDPDIWCSPLSSVHLYPPLPA